MKLFNYIGLAICVGISLVFFFFEDAFLAHKVGMVELFVLGIALLFKPRTSKGFAFTRPAKGVGNDPVRTKTRIVSAYSYEPGNIDWPNFNNKD
jgi:hypothetical protein